MMIAGKNRLHYSGALLIRVDPALRAQLAAAAEREQVSMKPACEAQRSGRFDLDAATSRAPACSTLKGSQPPLAAASRPAF